jgi:type II secretory pathway predicted ATPase ExeA
MYENYYGLREKPFSILPDPDMIYWGHSHRLAFAMLEFGVMNNAGFTVITGEIGSGKTTLLRYLLRSLDGNITVGLISNTPRAKAELLQWVMMSLKQPFEHSYATLFNRFQQFLQDQHGRGGRTILVVDEAQNLGLESLEELRMLSNINADKKQYLQIILIGQPQLKDLLRSPELVQFAQRVSSDFHLKPLNTIEVREYINYRLEAAGARKELFSEEASRAIAHASQGIPRTINILCDTALVYGFAVSAPRITGEIVSLVIENKSQYGVLPLTMAQPTLQSTKVEVLSRNK